MTKTIGKTYYLSHQAVIKEDHIRWKLRVVCGASFKLKGSLLSNYLKAGEGRYTDLFGTIIRFRLRNTAVAADIEKVF